MTQSIKAQAANVLLASKSTKASSQKQSTSSDFSNVMDDNLKTRSGSDSAKTAEETKETKSDDVNSNTSKEKVSQDSTDSTEKNSSKVDTASKGQEVSEADKTEEASSGDPVEKTSDAVQVDNLEQVTSGEELSALLTQSVNGNTAAEGIKDVLKNLKNTVLDTLGISEEQLEDAMETLGLTMVDLLNTDNLKQLVLQVNGTNDVSTILTDENLANSLQDLLQVVEDLKNNTGISSLSKEDMDKLLSQIQKSSEVSAEVTVPVEKTDASTNSVPVDTGKEITVEVVKTTESDLQKNSADTSNADKQGTNTEQTTTSLDSFIQNLAVNANGNTASFSEQIANVRQMQDIVNQIVEQVKVVLKPEQSSMEIQLNPESLGKINLSVVSKDGIMTAQLTTQNEITKQAIESQLQVLKENLNNQGLKVESIEVTVSNFDFNGNSQATAEDEAREQKNKSGRQFISDDSDVYSAEEEAVSTSAVNLNGSSIDYIA